ncbi:MAG: cation diffusion facilitator family transporter [Dokdonella sp.]|uniref:cation diffusion facilitator family transporter n=1 Tax=Dokdonella sp. TaxID=2291710 RepID=UPI0025C715D4|nr:cation diffusion facilitator family transporter [Dokdonella sp.]MBZ0222581.1 cation diffusion facilitator family transporter [Dokdonella sp.]
MTHSHDHGHDHASHAHAHDRREGKLFIAFALTLITLIVEAVGGYVSGSLALLADAGHMLVDALALLFAWLGARYAKRVADERRSYGYARVEVLVGYTNALAQFVLVAWIVYEATSRLFAPAPILSGMMLWVAVAGLLVNALVLRMLHSHDEDDLNTAGARLHVLGDLLGSLGAVVAALLIGQFGWLWADPAISIFVSLLILRSAWHLMARSAHILLEGAPRGLGAAQLAEAVSSADIGVHDIHHVHVWELAGGRAMATLHARMQAGVDADAALMQLRTLLHERFGIDHVTVQIESIACVGGHCGSSHGPDPAK